MRRRKKKWRKNEWHILVINEWMSRVRLEFEQNAWHERGWLVGLWRLIPQLQSISTLINDVVYFYYGFPKQ